MEDPSTQEADSDGPWQFNLRQLFLVSLFVALLFTMWRYWMYDASAAAKALVTGVIGLVAGRRLAIRKGLSPPGQWLVAGVGFAMVALNVWGWPSVRGSFKAELFVEYGWPLVGLLSLGEGLRDASFFTIVAVVNGVIALLLLFGALRFARKLEGSWDLVTPTKEAVMLAFLFGPTAMLQTARYAGYPQHLVIVAMSLPLVMGIIWGVCEASRGLARLEEEENARASTEQEGLQ